MKNRKSDWRRSMLGCQRNNGSEPNTTLTTPRLIPGRFDVRVHGGRRLS